MSPFDDFSRMSLDASKDTDGLGFAGRLLLRLLRNIRHGRLRVMLPSGAVMLSIRS